MELINYLGPLIVGALVGHGAFSRASNQPSGGRFRWTKAMNKELLEFYLNRMPGAMLANYFGCTDREVIRQVARLILGVKRAASDKNAPRYGEKWTWHDDQILFLEYQLGTSPRKIAARLGRDELGVVFRILTLIPPRIPRSTMRKYGLKNHSTAPNLAFQDRDTEFVKVCSRCHDAIEYCKCDGLEIEPHEGNSESR